MEANIYYLSSHKSFQKGSCHPLPYCYCTNIQHGRMFSAYIFITLLYKLITGYVLCKDNIKQTRLFNWITSCCGIFEFPWHIHQRLLDFSKRHSRVNGETPSTRHYMELSTMPHTWTTVSGLVHICCVQNLIINSHIPSTWTSQLICF